MLYNKEVNTIQYVVGVDEAGRGPLAGPVSVGVVLLPATYNNWKLWPLLKDSKKLSSAKRARWFSYMKGESIDASADALPDFSNLRFEVAMADAHTIDTNGIVPAIQNALDTALAKLFSTCGCDIMPYEVMVLLDGGLRAPEQFVHQCTIIRGDEQEPAIALASIAAKETRDTLMDSLAIIHPQYGFEAHKGYGTRRHIDALKTHGLSQLHRASFCTAFVSESH